MATEGVDVRVAVEKIVHDVLHKAAQEVADNYGVCILEAKFDWRDASTINKQMRQVERIWLQTVTRY